MKEHRYKQRISLGHKVNHLFPTDHSNLLFYGKKFIQYPDKSIHLHLELVCESGYSYGMVKKDDVVSVIDAKGGWRRIILVIIMHHLQQLMFRGRLLDYVVVLY